MANEEQLAILKQGVDVWNEWRDKHEGVRIDLWGADLKEAQLSGVRLWESDLSGADLSGADLREAKFIGANLGGANLKGADLSGANLTEADLSGTHLSGTHLRKANLSGAYVVGADFTEADGSGAHFSEANLSGADFTEADLRGAVLNGALLVATQFSKSNLSNCRVFGVSAWKINLKGAIQSNLIITDYGEPVITVDNLEIAQFIYLLIHNEKLRDVIDTIGKKAVLILGRFTDERKAVLEAIREELRKRDYIPILFDFEKPSSRDLTETIVTLAHLSRFVIADLTDAKSIPQELSLIVPDLPSVAVQPLILKDQREYAMFEHFQRYPWVLPIHEYESQAQLIADLSDKIIAPAEAKVIELRPPTL